MITSSFDPAPGIISPDMLVDRVDGLPDTCVITFSKTVLDHVLARYPHQAACLVPALNGERTIWRLAACGLDLLFYMSPITSAGAGLMLEQVAAATGARRFILFGSCGALTSSLTEGRLIVPTRAYRDEGLSYHYAPPADYITVRNAPLVAQVLDDLGLPRVSGPVWTTDALFRETRGNMDRRVSEGCIAVDMECAGLQALCDFRGYEYYTFFYTGDLLDAPAWEARILDSGSKEADHQLAAFLVALQVARRAAEDGKDGQDG
ncbi:MAG: nucleoside phosphorylase [Clostridiales bacterium]|nr:nucleoside phosphorylase [Clostridiales bacterium]